MQISSDGVTEAFILNLVQHVATELDPMIALSIEQRLSMGIKNIQFRVQLLAVNPIHVPLDSQTLLQLLTPHEIERYHEIKKSNYFIAKRIAAKMAFWNMDPHHKKIPFNQLEIAHDSLGCPYFYSGSNKISGYLLSLSDEANIVVALVVRLVKTNPYHVVPA